MQLTSLGTIVFFALAFCTECKAQNANKLEVSIIPALGFNLSFPAVTPRSSKDQLTYTIGTAVPKYYFAGIGLQLQLWDEWQTTLKIARTGYGYGWRYEYPLPPPDQKAKGSSKTAREVNILDFTTEKKLFTTNKVRLLNQDLKLVFQGLVGIRYASVPKLDRVDSLEALPSLFVVGQMNVKDSIRNLRYGSAAISLGLNAQLYVNSHRSIKVGAMYSYAPNPLLEYRTDVTYFIGSGSNDQFKTHSGKHQLLFYFEYPIRFLKWK
ncbi:MAG: hypothetical protein IT256_03595 [Chitinophagaceae bacterium]|nr:hypothetical protein [Chitinophagaceae bacterium]